ncbi:hypothetical protein Tco_1093152 [Tanacetum coccineum]|uniref:Uncharacterized protein n=1 Tax=Tanacetum coccineum TaxID=301880 RepID=A0ABQ5ID94_9ASTR
MGIGTGMGMRLRNGDEDERFYTSAGNPVKEILLKLNLPDHRKLKDGGEDAQDHILTYKLKIKEQARSSKDKGTISSLKSKITTSIHKRKSSL